MKSAHMFILSIVFMSNAQAGELALGKASLVKRQSDQILNQLQIPTTEVKFEFPKSFTKAVLNQLSLDLPKIEQKVGQLINSQGSSSLFELAIQANSGNKLFKSCQNKIKTSAIKNGQNVNHNLIALPTGSAQIVKLQNDEWLVSLNTSGPVTLALEVQGQSNLLAETNFEVINQPLPVASLGRLINLNSGTGSISTAELKAQTRLNLKSAEIVEISCATFTPYTISSFRLKLFTSTPRNVVNEGASFSQAIAVINTVRPGDMLSFSQISLTHPDLTGPVSAPNIIIETR